MHGRKTRMRLKHWLDPRGSKGGTCEAVRGRAGDDPPLGQDGLAGPRLGGGQGAAGAAAAAAGQSSIRTRISSTSGCGSFRGCWRSGCFVDASRDAESARWMRAMLADPKMPGAREAGDDILAQADGGGVTAGKAIDSLLGAQMELRSNRRLHSAMRARACPPSRRRGSFDFAIRTRHQARARRAPARVRLRSARRERDPAGSARSRPDASGHRPRGRGGPVRTPHLPRHPRGPGRVAHGGEDVGQPGTSAQRCVRIPPCRRSSRSAACR